MCLISNTDKPKIAKHNIVCYKEVIDGGDYYETPYVHACLDKHVLNYAKGKSNIVLTYYLHRQFYEIYGGYIHAYTTPNKITRYGKIVPCIIPKGAKYFEDNVFKEICADKMIIDKEYKPTLKERILKLFGY